MTSFGQVSVPDAAALPRLDDGMASLQEVVGTSAEAPVSQIMDAEADQLCEGGANSRNGYRERGLDTCVGRRTPRIPKLRSGSFFPEDVVGRHQGVDRAVVAAVAEMVTNGVSTRKVKRVARSMGIGRMGASQVSRICGSLDETVADLRGRDLSDASYPYIWLDATHIKCGGDGRARSTAPAAAIGAGSGGHGRLLWLDAIDAESYDGWRAFLLSLRARGAAGTTTRQKRGAVLGIPKAVFAERDPELVRELYQLAIDRIGGFCPRAAEVFEETEADALAYLDLPYERHVRLRTDNVQERANREPRRRSRVVHVFPSRESLIRMIGTAFSKMDEDWASRRWYKEEYMGRAVEGARANAPALAYGAPPPSAPRGSSSS